MAKEIMLSCPSPSDETYKRLTEAVGAIAAYSIFNKNNGDISFLKDYTKESMISYSKQISHEKSHTTPLVHIKMMLLEKLDRLKNSTAKNKAFKENQIQRQLDKLEGVEEAIGIAATIDYLYDEAIGEEGKGWISKLDDYVKKVDTMYSGLDKLSPEERKARLIEIQEILQHYYDYAESLDYLDDYAHLYGKEVFAQTNPPEGSTLWKINKLSVAKEKIKEKYKEAILPVTAKILYTVHSKETNAAIQKDFEQTMNSLAARSKKGEDVSKLKEDAEKRYSENYVTEEMLLNNLKLATKDIGYLDKMLTPMISLGDSSLSLFAKFIKKDFTQARWELASWKQDLSKAYRKFSKGGKIDSPHLLNKEITEVISEWVYDQESGEYVERRHNALVQQLDLNSYNQAKERARKEAAQFKKGSKEARKVWSKFYATHTEPLSMEDYTEYGQVNKGIRSIIADKVEEKKKGILSEEQFAQWVSRNIHHQTLKDNNYLASEDETGRKVKKLDELTYTKEVMEYYASGQDLQFRGELVVPRLKLHENKQWFAIQNNPRLKEYHDTIVSEYLKSQSRLPKGKQNGYVLPYKYKSKRELLAEGKFKEAGKTALKEGFTIRKDDTEYGDPNAQKTNPIYYTTYIPAEESSLDVFESIVEFEKMSKMHQVISEIEPTANAFRTLIADRDTLYSDNKGNRLTSIAKKLGVEDFVKQRGVSNASEMVDWFIEQQLYHEFNLKEMVNTPLGQLDAGKTISTAMSAASLSMLGGPEFLKSMANTVQAKIQRGIEAASGEYFDKKDLAYGEKEFVKHSKNILDDFAKPISTSLEGQLLDMVDFIQGQFMDEFGNNISGSSMKKLATSGTWMFANNFSEYQTQASSAFALMNTVKLKDGEKEINLKEAYVLGEDGKIKLKDGVTKLDGSEWTQDDLFNFMNRLHALNKRMDGVYNSFDRSLAKRWSIWRLILMFKGFLAPTVKKRFKSYGADQELGGVTEGFYRTFYRTAIKDTQNLLAFLMRKENTLTDLQRNNVRRAITELSLIVLLTAGIAAMSWAGEDDEELKKSWGYQFMFYQMVRAQSELKFYQPGFGLEDQLRIFQSPSAISGFLDRATKLGAQMFDPFEEYKVKSGWNEKGDSKLKARALMLLGFNGNNFTPSQATEVFNK